MDTVGGPTRVDPWRESLERSLARRPQAARRTIVPAQQRMRLPSYRHLLWRSFTNRWLTVIMSVSGILTLALLVTTPPRGQITQASAAADRAAALRPHSNSSSARGVGAPPAAGRTGSSRATSCPMADSQTGYRNPLAGATVTAKRIDQGVDYAGSGTLTAMGAARITQLATVDTGWPGAFIQYQLLSGPDSGCYVYYAEGVSPTRGLHVGEMVRPGQPLASIIPGSSSGIEIGWGVGDGTKTYAAATGGWSATHEANDIPSAAGLYFSSLIAALGGPPGKVEG